MKRPYRKPRVCVFTDPGYTILDSREYRLFASFEKWLRKNLINRGCKCHECALLDKLASLRREKGD